MNVIRKAAVQMLAHLGAKPNIQGILQENGRVNLKDPMFPPS